MTQECFDATLATIICNHFLWQISVMFSQIEMATMPIKKSFESPSDVIGDAIIKVIVVVHLCYTITMSSSDPD